MPMNVERCIERCSGVQAVDRGRYLAGIEKRNPKIEV
jgi:hypothetical protein